MTILVELLDLIPDYGFRAEAVALEVCDSRARPLMNVTYTPENTTNANMSRNAPVAVHVGTVPIGPSILVLSREKASNFLCCLPSREIGLFKSEPRPDRRVVHHRDFAFHTAKGREMGSFFATTRLKVKVVGRRNLPNHRLSIPCDELKIGTTRPLVLRTGVRRHVGEYDAKFLVKEFLFGCSCGNCFLVLSFALFDFELKRVSSRLSGGMGGRVMAGSPGRFTIAQGSKPFTALRTKAISSLPSPSKSAQTTSAAVQLSGSRYTEGRNISLGTSL